MPKHVYTPSDELHAAIYNDNTGIARYELNKDRTLHERTTWNHLYDAVQCGTVSPMEAYDCIRAGRVFENILTRESNYSHLVK